MHKKSIDLNFSRAPRIGAARGDSAFVPKALPRGEPARSNRPPAF